MPNKDHLPFGQVYSLHDPETQDLRYIGQTTHTLEARLKQHMRQLKARTYKNNWIRSLLGARPLIRCVCFAVSQADLDELEIMHIEKARISGCRLTNSALGGRGGRHSEETILKMRLAHTGKVFSLEARANMSKAKMGHEVSEETRKKIASANTGHVLTSDDRAKLSNALLGHNVSDKTKQRISESRKGQKLTDETKAKLSEAQKGKNHSEETKSRMRGKKMSEETKRKISDSLKGKPKKEMSAETRSKISASRKGKPLSAETRLRMSAAQKTRWQHQ